MDKKELQNLIDRISLTGPEGIKKIKKVLKELSDASSDSMGEDEEYTIAQALNDLNERIEELSKNTKPDKVIIDVLSFTGDNSDSEAEALSRLSINGETPTKQQIKDILNSLQDVSIRYLDGQQTIYLTTTCCFIDDSGFSIRAGYDSRGDDSECFINITIEDEYNAVVLNSY